MTPTPTIVRILSHRRVAHCLYTCSASATTTCVSLVVSDPPPVHTVALLPVLAQKHVSATHATDCELLRYSKVPVVADGAHPVRQVPGGPCRYRPRGDAVAALDESPRARWPEVAASCRRASRVGGQLDICAILPAVHAGARTQREFQLLN